MRQRQITAMLRIAALLERQLSGKLTIAESKELKEWIDGNNENRELYNKLLDAQQRNTALEELARYDGLSAWHSIRNRLSEQSAARRHYTMRYYVAAAVVLIVGLLSAGIFMKHASRQPKLTVLKTKNIIDGTDNSHFQARLILADGKSINLQGNHDSAFSLSGVTVNQTDGQLSYAGIGKLANNNVILTPKGGMYRLRLSDGTVVWLNAATSLSYPSFFEGSTRTVQLQGEAYFEVAPDKTKPFLVEIPGGTTVRVLGTHFNIMAYQNENHIVTTLLEGSVMMQHGAASGVLSPGQQATFTNGSNNLVISSVDGDEAVAWKNGLFEFNGRSLESVMRELSRWYDVEVTYEGDVKKKDFTCSFSHDASLADILRMLELTGVVKFKVTDNKVEVSPP